MVVCVCGRGCFHSLHEDEFWAYRTLGMHAMSVLTLQITELWECMQ